MLRCDLEILCLGSVAKSGGKPNLFWWAHTRQILVLCSGKPDFTLAAPVWCQAGVKCPEAELQQRHCQAQLCAESINPCFPRQPGLVGAVHAHGRSGMRWALRFLPVQGTPGLCDKLFRFSTLWVTPFHLCQSPITHEGGGSEPSSAAPLWVHLIWFQLTCRRKWRAAVPKSVLKQHCTA